VRTTARRTVALAALAATCAAAGCGGEEEYANEPRPPTPINVTAAIGNGRVSVSPRSFGAGPVVLIVSNQTAAPQTLTFETEELGGSEPGLKQSTSPINPRGTTTLQVDARQGTYAVSTGERSIEPATVNVGSERESAQDKLLQP
jgi:hypothetical protein